MSKFKKICVADFETSVYEGQEKTEVWAAGLAQVGRSDEHVSIVNSIEEFFGLLYRGNIDIICYFHNLKFDGSYILNYFFKYKFKNAWTEGEGFKKDKDLKNKEFTYLISDMGLFYAITLKLGNKLIKFYDSYKILPFSLEEIGKSFNLKHHKSSMEYKGERHAGGIITKDEEEYLKNDVLVLKDAIELIMDKGYTKMTIGSNAMKYYKDLFNRKEYNTLFPDITKVYLKNDKISFCPDGASTDMDTFVRKSYYGAWCYCNPKYQCQRIVGGEIFDVNSLYSSEMHSVSGNCYPVGLPQQYIKVKNNKIPAAYDAAYKNKTGYYFVHLKMRFKIKKNKLPFLHIKGNKYYDSTKNLETSDYQLKDGSFSRYVVSPKNELLDSVHEFTFTCTDWIRIKEFYNIYDLEIIDCVFFDAKVGIFDDYINYWYEIKSHATGAERQFAKLFLNNLYGKFATSNNSSYKVAEYIDGKLHFKTIVEFNKKVSYIAIGSAITSYARDLTIRKAQENYKYFCYADTDSLHLACDISKVKGLEIHSSNLRCWKNEGTFDEAFYTRQKTYIEHIIGENGVLFKDMENPKKTYYKITCAGMGQRSKDLFIMSLTGEVMEKYQKSDYKLNKEELDFINQKRKITDFVAGLVVPSKLQAIQYIGGMLLVETDFEMNEKVKYLFKN